MIPCVSQGEVHGKCISLWSLGIRFIALLWRSIMTPLGFWFSHVNRRWGHASLVIWGHSEQLGFECVRGQKMFFPIMARVLCIAII